VPNIVDASAQFGEVKYLSGVPRYTGTIALSVSFTGVTSEFYNLAHLARITGNCISTQTYVAQSADINFIYTHTTTPYTLLFSAPIVYANPPSITFTVYSTQYSASRTLTPNEYLDVGENENSLRVQSGVGQTPDTFGEPYDSAQSLAENEELQYLNGFFVYPPAIDWRVYDLSGPDYRALSGGSYAGFRWVTQKFTISTLTRGIVRLVNFSGSASFLMYMKVGAQLFDCTQPFIPPSSFGCLEYGGTTSGVNGASYIAYITTGAAIVTDTVLIRVGVNSSMDTAFARIEFEVVV
jgi:hypothetical protein